MEKAAAKEDRVWSKVGLRIMGETLRPEEVESALGLKASRSHLRGQRGSARQKNPWRESLWSLHSPLGDDRDIADHLTWLLDLLEPKLNTIRKLSEKYRIDIFCGFSSGSGQGGFTLDAKTLARLASLAVPLVLDLYPPSVENDEYEAGFK
jgi:hypothetical protein